MAATDKISIKIHRGTHQIGGCVTEVAYRNSRILIDFGSELPSTEKEPEELRIPGFTKEEDESSVDDKKDPPYHAVFYTHHHGDHMGMFKSIKSDIPQYMGATARRIMATISKWIRDEEALQILNNNQIIRTIEEKQPVVIGNGDIVITPYSVDHSAYDSYMYLIEAGGKRILHTGDFREHGYRGKALLSMLKYYVCREDKLPIDILIIEGTMMSRKTEKVMRESELKKKAIDLLKVRRHAFLLCSSTNLDSLASFCQAAKELRIPIICNGYQKEVFQIYNDTAGEKSEIYQFKHVYTFGDDHHLRQWKGISQEEYIREHGFLMLVKAEDSYVRRMEPFEDLEPILIYSMWEGYIDPASPSYNKELAEMMKRWKGISLHTSGHATTDTIERVIRTVKPQEAIIPIHSEKIEEFRNLDISEEFLAKVCLLQDGDVWYDK